MFTKHSILFLFTNIYFIFIYKTCPLTYCITRRYLIHFNCQKLLPGTPHIELSIYTFCAMSAFEQPPPPPTDVACPPWSFVAWVCTRVQDTTAFLPSAHPQRSPRRKWKGAKFPWSRCPTFPTKKKKKKVGANKNEGRRRYREAGDGDHLATFSTKNASMSFSLHRQEVWLEQRIKKPDPNLNILTKH